MGEFFAKGAGMGAVGVIGGWAGRCVRGTLTVLLLAGLAACGGGSSSSSGASPVGGSGSGTTGTTGTTSTSTTTTTTTTSGSISLALASQSITSGIPTTVTATLVNGSGAAIPGAVVTFTTDSQLGTFSPASGTALTDAAGRASVQLSAASSTAAGAATVTASATVGTTVLTTARGYSVGAASIAVSTPAFGANPLSAFGNTSVTTTVTSNGTPLAGQLVTFASPCASSGKASLTSSVVSASNGTAQATYQDNGCGTTDIITASASGLASASGSLAVLAPAVGSIQYVSVSPSTITLKGTGGAGMQETARVTFKVVDAAGQPLGGKDVAFSLSTTAGGIALSATSAKSDPTTGQVSVIVSAGTVATPVRVIASTSGPSGATLVTQSDQLVISTGIPDQDSVSLSASVLNFEALNIDGNQISLTIRLADHFNNPVPNGTAVSFTAEGGAVQPSCTTQGGACTVTLTSSNPRPANGRVTVMAYAIGEESFTDTLNGNGKADTGEYQNVGEAFRDDNANGVRDGSEPFVDYDLDNTYDDATADANYNGLLCNTSCSASKSLHVWGDIEIVFSGSTAFIGLNPGQIDLGGCGSIGAMHTADLIIMDVNGNPMPAGTKIEISTTNGVLDSSASEVQPSTNGAPLVLKVRVKNDDTTTGCASVNPPVNPATGATPSGSLKVKVTSPGAAGQQGTKSEVAFDVLN